MSDPIVILAASRTPIGAFMGELSSVTAVDLGRIASKSALAASGVDASQIDECYFGCVLPAGLGQAPARQVLLGAGGEVATPCTTVNKVCGSGMKALQFAQQALLLDESQFTLVGGMESMSRAPHLLTASRAGLKMGNHTALDHMLCDGLEDASTSQLMGHFADQTAVRYNFSREAQDAFALQSVQFAKQAQSSNAFADEIAPVETKRMWVSADEGPQRAREEKIPSLKPAFSADGSVTAANASSLADGAAAIVLSKENYARNLGLNPIARVLGIVQHAQSPEWFTTAPVGAIQKLLAKTNVKLNEIDLFEINEAFAVVPMACIAEFGIERSKINVNGGACALGHPLGATGARIVVTLVHALLRRGGGKGIAVLCIGGGEAMAVLVEV